MIHVPFRESVARWNSVLISGWQDIEIIKIWTDDAEIIGYGETLVNYTWQRVSDEAIARAMRSNPAELLADDRIGAGLQMALYDLVGKALGAPMYRLLAQQKVREWCPISWWNTKLPPELLAAEARTAAAEGYTAQKFKGRPWFDVYEQVAAVAQVTPEHFRVDIDWNSFLLSASSAVPVLRELEATGRIGIFESPIARTDVAGHREIREKISAPLAEHFDPVLFPVWMRDDALDGFVAYGAGVAGTLQQGIVSAAFNKNLWLQICGTGLTTAMTVHLGAVLSHARWPAVTGMNTFAHDLLKEPITIAGGFARVPEAPGLGVVVDDDLVERLRVATEAPPTPPRRLLTFQLGDGRECHFGNIEQLWAFCASDGSLPVQPRGARLELTDDDGTKEFDMLHTRATSWPVWDVSRR